MDKPVSNLPSKLDPCPQLQASARNNTVNHFYLLLTNVIPDVWCAEILSARKIIGRSSQVSIGVPSRFGNVSRRHAEVWKDERGIWIYSPKLERE